jgi:hypothetical protein
MISAPSGPWGSSIDWARLLDYGGTSKQAKPQQPKAPINVSALTPYTEAGQSALTGTSPQSFMPPNPPVPSGTAGWPGPTAPLPPSPTPPLPQGAMSPAPMMPSNDLDNYLMRFYLMQQYPGNFIPNNSAYPIGR